MLSFKPVCEDGICEFLKLSLEREMPVDEDYLREVLLSFSSLADEDIECCVTYECGCLLVRIFDMGRYSFVYPIALCDTADEMGAVLSLRDYALKEEIPLVITDTPSECIGVLTSLFRHMSLDASDASAESFCVSVNSEIALLDDIPSFFGERIELSPLCGGDTAAYAALCRDREVNKYWGYDDRSDASDNVGDDYFLGEANAEYNRSVALTLAVRLDGEFIGDAVIYAFDLCGGAEIAFRLLPGFQGRGFGRELVNTLFKYAEKIGLLRLRARVKKENIRSKKLLSSVIDNYTDESDIIIFEKEL